VAPLEFSCRRQRHLVHGLAPSDHNPSSASMTKKLFTAFVT
jgi:hypothetical protein